MARIFVEVIDPASMSLDALEDFIGFQHKSGTAHITVSYTHLDVYKRQTHTERLDDKNVWNKDVFDRFNERLKVMVIDWLTELPDQHENLQNMLWKYAIAWAAEQMEEDHGSKVLEAMLSLIHISSDEYHPISGKVC